MIQPLQIFPIANIGEITQKSSLSKLLFDALANQQLALQEKDILVVTQKIVSKTEGRIVDLETITPSTFAQEIADKNHKDPRHIEIVLRESKRIVRMDHGVIIAETQQGFICANAGVDESNTGNKKTVTLLPLDPDNSAKRIVTDLTAMTNVTNLATIISDTWGRPWREGQVNFAIGIHGMEPLTDYRGIKDAYGYAMKASVVAVADEIAAAAELVMGKTQQIPAALVRGYNFDRNNGSGKDLLRDQSIDMFR